MVCEGVSSYMCNMEIYTAEWKKLEDKVLSLLDKFRLESLLHMISKIYACHYTEHRKERQENKNANKETLFRGSSTINLWWA